MNQNLTYLQKVLLQQHFRLGHVGFQQLQWIGRQGILGKLGERMGKTSVHPPKCAACQFGKQDRNPKEGSTVTKTNEGVLKADKLNPGDLVFADQYESRLPGRVFNRRGMSITSQKYCGGSLYCDAASRKIFVHHQVSLNAVETIEGKMAFEREAAMTGNTVKAYCADNGIYTSKDFLQHLQDKSQSLKLSGVGGHHVCMYV